MTELQRYANRTHFCGELRVKNTDQTVELAGWVHSRRDHGGLLFIDLRDRTGLVQVVFDPNENKEAFEAAEAVRPEFVLRVGGHVRARPEGTVNEAIGTGEIEVAVTSIVVLNSAETPPFEIDDDLRVDDGLRLQYRYLDLRRSPMLGNLRMRHTVARAAREFLDRSGFTEVETPVLTKSTPEGARDYLVPSRVHRGHFYALPQSPQIFKQILMIAGVDRYYQFARCFRDEDLRADRQPEHTQIDIEMSFVDREDVMNLVEDMVRDVFEIAGKPLPKSFRRLPYRECMERFGSDRPDLRYGMEIHSVSAIVKDSQLRIFAEQVRKGGVVAGISLPKGSVKSRADIDTLIEFAKTHGAKGLAWLGVGESSGPASPIAKNISDDERSRIEETLKASDGETIVLVADAADVAYPVLGSIRVKVADDRGLARPGVFEPLWVTDFPLFEFDEREKRMKSVNHPFTLPATDSLDTLEDKPLEAISCAYDLVINGSEVGGGSLRISQRALQQKIFEILGLTPEETKTKFGFLLEALKYGTPPHGGIALGLDRLVSIVLGLDSIRDVIAFPKTQTAADLLTGAPDAVKVEQLKELGLKTEP